MLGKTIHKKTFNKEIMFLAYMCLKKDGLLCCLYNKCNKISSVCSLKKHPFELINTMAHALVAVINF